jgi:hypothetical protein
MSDSFFTIENFVTAKPGDPYRLLPYGTISKGGRKVNITPEFAAKLRLPHYKPPIKLGSHAETTPAGGHIVALEAREDGIYAIPEYVPAGERALADGNYRYHSPEVLFQGYMEATDGTKMYAPLILGDALLHSPHLGELSALYTAEVTQELHMSENVTVPASLFEKFMSKFFPETPAPVEPPAPEAPVVPEAFAAQLSAAQAEVEEYKTKLAAREQADALAARVTSFTAELAAVKVDTALATLLAALPDETTAPLMVAFKALSEQVKESNLTAPVGTQAPAGTNADPREALNAAVLAKMGEMKTDYNAALELVRAEQPDLFAAGFGAQKE